MTEVTGSQEERSHEGERNSEPRRPRRSQRWRPVDWPPKGGLSRCKRTQIQAADRQAVRFVFAFSYIAAVGMLRTPTNRPASPFAYVSFVPPVNPFPPHPPLTPESAGTPSPVQQDLQQVDQKSPQLLKRRRRSRCAHCRASLRQSRQPASNQSDAPPRTRARVPPRRSRCPWSTCRTPALPQGRRSVLATPTQPGPRNVLSSRRWPWGRVARAHPTAAGPPAPRERHPHRRVGQHPHGRSR